MLLKLDRENSKREAEQKAYAKGKGEGLAEAQLEIARKMKAKYPVEDIAEMTGLSVDEIQKL